MVTCVAGAPPFYLLSKEQHTNPAIFGFAHRQMHKLLHATPEKHVGGETTRELLPGWRTMVQGVAMRAEGPQMLKAHLESGTTQLETSPVTGDYFNHSYGSGMQMTSGTSLSIGEAALDTFRTPTP